MENGERNEGENSLEGQEADSPHDDETSDSKIQDQELTSCQADKEDVDREFSDVCLDSPADGTPSPAPVVNDSVNPEFVPSLSIAKSKTSSQDIQQDAEEKVDQRKAEAMEQVSIDKIFTDLETKIESGKAQNKEVVSTLLQGLVGGMFDMESRFVIKEASAVLRTVNILDKCSPTLQAELWSVFIAILRKSTQNLEACSEIGLITLILARLPTSNEIIADLFMELLGVLASYSINVKEMKGFLKALRGKDNKWPRHSAKLLHVLKQTPRKEGPDVFFCFSGSQGAGLALPPMRTWPTQNGFTFSTWFRMDPFNSVNFEREKPYLYCFRTSKGMGYSAHFVGSCLVLTSAKTQTRGFQHCIKYEFAPRKWYMVSIVYVYNRWSRSEVRCFVNGQQIDMIDMTWIVHTPEHYDKCFIGCSPEGERETCFCGQIGAIYLFSDSLSMQQINSMYCLGPSYQNQFRFDSETTLPEGYRKYLFDGRLSGSLVFAYCPKNCDRQLCLESSPKQNQSYFVHTPHALMQQMLLPLFSQLDFEHEVPGGDKWAVDYTICYNLLSVVCQLLEQNPSNQHQMFHNRGFLVISQSLQQASKKHIVDAVLDTFLSTAKFLLSSPSGIPLLKQLFDYVLFNPGLWIHTPAPIQVKLYHYLATDFLSNSQFYGNIRRVSTLLQMVHALKYYYWIVNPEHKSGFLPKGLDGPRPNNMDIAKVRNWMLVFIRKVFNRAEGNKDDELQALLNFLSTVNEDDNIYDVLQTTITLMSEDPAAMVPGFDKKNGVCVVFKLIASPNELVRIPGLKLLGYFLCRSTPKRKQDVMGPYNLFTLLTERLLLHASYLTMATYNVLFEILTEEITNEIVYERREAPEPHNRFENPMILKVIANLISQSKPCPDLMEVKNYFLTDLIALCGGNRDNRRTILQMSVWQEWLVSLAYIFPRTDEEGHISNLVYQLFTMLLHHAIRLEYGGWRVWVDTLAIVHSKVSFEKFKMEMSKKYNLYREERADTNFSSEERARLPVSTIYGYRGNDPVLSEVADVLSAVINHVCNSEECEANGRSSDVPPHMMGGRSKQERKLSNNGYRDSQRHFFRAEPQRPIYRTPEYKWSHVHLKLLSDVLAAVESDVVNWKSDQSKTVIDFVNSSENTVFVVNTVHVISQLVDNLVMACGGLLPLLAAATSPNVCDLKEKTLSELEISDGTQQGLNIDVAVLFLIRFVNLVDVFVFASSLNFSELEQEKNMPSGGILRQCLRLVATVAVRNCLLCRAEQVPFKTVNGSYANGTSVREEAIKMLISQPSTEDTSLRDILNQTISIQDTDYLLQEIDLNRLKAVIYRDMEETKQAQFLALAVVYFLSVLMVSRYRDILEPPASPSPFFCGSPTVKTTPEGKTTGSSPSEPIAKEPLAVNGEAPSEEIKQKPVEYRQDEVQPLEAITRVEVHESPKKISGAENTDNDAGALDETEEIPLDDVEGEEGVENNNESAEQVPISAIQVSADQNEEGENDSVAQYRPDDLKLTSDVENVVATIPRERQVMLSNKLQKALQTTAPLLRELMTDFQSFLQKTLLGTHSQEIMIDSKVLTTLRNQQGSVIELVMLLCSQEWQTSLQKHAGLAFIELVNEGRLLAHATRDHIVRVANEAEFILNRLRAEDVSKHADFEAICAQVTLSRKEEEKTCDHLISAARRRDAIMSLRIVEKIVNLLTSEHGAWRDQDRKRTFWKLDIWEDDSRRKKRLIPNPYGSSHPEATLKAAVEHGASQEEVEKAREAVLTQLTARGIISPSQATAPSGEETLDETEVSKWAEEGKDLEPEISEATNYWTSCKLIWPGLVIPGTLSITSNEVYFDCNEDDVEFRQQDSKVLRFCDNLHARWHFSEIRAIFLRRFLLQNVSLEIFLAARTAVMLVFPDFATVKKVVQFLPRVGVGVKYGLPQSRRTSLMTPRQLFKHSDMPQKWQKREISNFDYIMFLNTIAGRTFNDLNQYPVFPWIISNFEAKELDLNLPTNFRDLSKPIGALNPSRKAYFEERYGSWDHEKIPPFHYGTHYSTAAFVLNWLVRVEPFTTMYLNLQGGKFDHADRVFSSTAQAWRSCQRDTHDVKELIPEFFYLPEMFVNSNSYKFGRQDDGSLVTDVDLPPWAKTPEEFVAIHKAALESDLVSCQIHQWIDLIFGYKQRGPEAVRATNVFYYLTYEGAIDLTSVDDQIMRQALEGQIRNFGQTPAQLLAEPHPPRQSLLTISPMVFNPIPEDMCMVLKFISNSPIVHISANTYSQLSNPTVVSITANMGFALNKWNNSYMGPSSAPGPSFSAPGTNTAPSSESYSAGSQPPNLPLTVDQLLATGNPALPIPKRHLGEAFDQRLTVQYNNFITTVDSKCIMTCGYTDYSFRVINTDTGKVTQVIYGHKGVVTCLSRSECNIVSDCYIASGSRDCTVLLWHWNAKNNCVAGEFNMPGELPSPRAVLTGHDDDITSIVVSAEHGIVVSASKDGSMLIHTTQGELLRCLEVPSESELPKELLTCPTCILMSRECQIVACYDRRDLCVFTTSGRVLQYHKGDSHVQCMCLTRDGAYVLVAGDDGVVTIYRMFSLEKLYSYQPCDSSIKSIALAQNHRFVLCGLSSGAIAVLNVDFNKWHKEYQTRYASH